MHQTFMQILKIVIIIFNIEEFVHANYWKINQSTDYQDKFLNFQDVCWEIAED